MERKDAVPARVTTADERRSLIPGRLYARAFDASDAPFLVVDRNLRIQAVNPAYARATLQPAGALLGRFIFDAFPDNPCTPEAHSVQNLTRSLETVFRRGRSDRMPIQHYDVPAPTQDGRFVHKVWSPTNSPLHDADGRVAGVLHHVEDVTAATGAEDCVGEEADRPQDDGAVIVRLAAALAHEQRASAELGRSNENLRIALQSSREIGMALGILMFSRKVTAEAAFGLLCQISQTTHRKLRDIALDIVEQGCVDDPAAQTGLTPQDGPRR